MSDDARPAYLPAGLPIPVAEPDGLSEPYWAGLRQSRLMVQRCSGCQTWQFGPEWLCHRCHAFNPEWVEVEPRGRIFSWQRVWHPSHAALRQHGPYLAVLVELPHVGDVRMVGNLLGDPMQPVTIGDDVAGVFEHHPESVPSYSLLHWRKQ
jgi:uncharacterized OB-fold protein